MTVPSESPPAPRPQSADQTWLKGKTLYLRGARASDARSSIAWRQSVFPLAPKAAETALKELIGDDDAWNRVLLLAARTDTDDVVGSATVNVYPPDPSAHVELHAAPLLPGHGQAEKAEMMGILLPWLIDERGAFSVTVETRSSDEQLNEELAALGMRQAFRFREMTVVDGSRVDCITWQTFNPAWVAKLGDPGAGIDQATEMANQPHRLPTALRRDRSALPRGTIVASERVMLRPFEVEDGALIAASIRRDTEGNFANGRWPASPIAISWEFDEDGKATWPKNFSMAVVRRSDGQLIGDVGLFNINWVNRTAETGSWLYAAEHRGAGYGTEAKRLLLEYAFDQLGMHTLWSWVHIYNDRSAAALRKQGYRDAGLVHWVGFGHKGIISGQLFDLLASEWRANRAEPGP